MSLKHVSEPLRIKSLELRNRVVRTASTTSMSPFVDDALIAYHEARGGVALSVLEAGGVHPSSRISYSITDETMISLEKLMRAVRPHGMQIFQQLWHGGYNMPRRQRHDAAGPFGRDQSRYGHYGRADGTS